MTDLRGIAHALGGEVCGRRVRCPGPGHSRKDRSLSVCFDPRAPDGFTADSFAGDDWRACKDYVRGVLGLARDPKIKHARQAHLKVRPLRHEPEPDRTALALKIWREATDPRGTPVEAYLQRRGLDGLGLDGGALRFHAACPFAGARTRAMLALVRNIRTDTPVGIHRTALDRDGNKVEVNGEDRRALGPIAGGAIKLTPDADVTSCLGIGEGIETTLSLQQASEFGRSPVWSLVSARGVKNFPLLSGIECLWIAVDHDPAGLEAAGQCADRWRTAGREAFLVKPIAHRADLNDVVRRARHAA